MVYLYSLLAIFSTWKWGNWRNWQEYYPTILFYITINLLHLVLTYDHPQWVFHDYFVPNGTIKTLIMIFTQYPCFTILFCTYLPSNKPLLPLYFVLWTCLFGILEFISILAGVISYKNGWHFGWSILLNLCTFSILYLHYKRPLWGWVLSFILTSIFLIIFQVPITKLK
ncbi:CBO0543 family protein [Brevibacillus sp. SYSU BS000544]|uniref:CBO0543 family protein n=1 Tax=Brevibacillus sp. SYSU BS000544 TaxID=3416443 RepID=UPI003CE53A15